MLLLCRESELNKLVKKKLKRLFAIRTEKKRKKKLNEEEEEILTVY